MNTVKLLLMGTLVLLLMQACVEKTETVGEKIDTTISDTLIIGCVVSYDINPSDNKEQINKVYGKNHVKDGHWITFGLADSKNTKNQISRIKLEEGYYRRNKKVGFWKFFKEDGTIEDSVEYKNDVPLTDKL